MTERPPAESVYFDAVLRPHRSLGPAGFAALMFGVAGISFLAGLRFWALGAWPVAAFLALDVLLIYGGFKLSYWSARRYEAIRLTERALTVHQVDPRGNATVWSFQPYWLRVDIAATSDEDGPLTLASHGHAVEIGAFLPPTERREVGQALARALARLRNPRFD
jgi:uncharacterized membrane protein